MSEEGQASESIAHEWDQVAEGFDELVTPINMGSGEKALGLVELGAGKRLLDVAAGSGAISLPAARAGADVLATDISPDMVGRLQARAKKAGLSNLTARVMDGTNLEVEDDAFDVSASQHGVTLFPEMDRGLAEMTRVTKSGGQILVVTFGPLDEAGFVAIFLDAVRTAVPQAPVPTSQDPPLPFQASDPGELTRRLEAAGLEQVHVETVVEEASFASPKKYWSTLVNSNPIGAQLDGLLNADQRARALEVVEAAFQDQPAPDGGGLVSSKILVGVGTKPQEGA